MTLFVQFLLNGVIAGTIYALLAMSVTLVYGLTSVINFAVGEFLMIGSYVTLFVAIATGNYAIAFVSACILAGVVGFVTERGAFRFTYDKPLAGFIVSLGLILAFQGLVGALWGPDVRRAQPPLQGLFELGGLFARRQAVLNVVVALVTIAVFYVVLRRTRYGKSLRAVADDRIAAGLVGIPVRRILASTFVVGAVLAGGAGWIVATMTSVDPFVGGAFLLRAFAVALIGGLGNIQGAAIAGIALGLVEHLAIGYGDPLWSEAYLYGAVVLVLLIRPEGLWRGVAGAKL